MVVMPTPYCPSSDSQWLVTLCISASMILTESSCAFSPLGSNYVLAASAPTFSSSIWVGEQGEMLYNEVSEGHQGKTLFWESCSHAL